MQEKGLCVGRDERGEPADREVDASVFVQRAGADEPDALVLVQHTSELLDILDAQRARRG